MPTNISPEPHAFQVLGAGSSVESSRASGNLTDLRLTSPFFVHVSNVQDLITPSFVEKHQMATQHTKQTSLAISEETVSV